MRRPILSLMALFLAVLLLLPLAPAAEAFDASEIQVVLDGTPMEFDVQPQLVNGRVLVPVRFIAEELGAQVEWYAPTLTVTIEKNDDVISLTIGSDQFKINGETKQMDVAPRLVGNRTLVPVRFVAEALDHCVDWFHAIRTVAINTPDEVRELPLYDMTYTLANDAGIAVHDFTLEDGTLTTWNDLPVPAPMAGLIAVPNGTGPHPIVFVIHGVARFEDIRDPVYAGFDYLVQQLAAEGYVAVSINVNVDYTFDYGESFWGGWAYSLWEQHIERLKAANAGEDMGHGLDLTGRIDFDEIHLIGHSRGGELADIFYRRDRQGDISRIHSIIRIASTTLLYYFDENDIDTHPSIPVGIILPEFDGDVMNNEGQAVFDEILAAGEIPSVVSLVYLRGANHNFFNRFGEVDDATQQVNRITRSQQEDFMKHYAAAFLALVTRDRAPWGAFSPSYAQVETMFGYRVVASTYIPGVRSVIAVPSETTAANAVAGAGASVAFHLQAWGEDGYFTHPGVSADHHLPLYDIQWTASGTAVQFPVLTGDFGAHHALSLYIAVDSSNSRNPQGQNQALAVTLQDATEETRTVIIPPGTAALTWNPGYAEQEEWGTHWIGQMPLGELRIPLALFGGIDLGNITDITVSFDQTNTGAVMLSAMYLT